MVRNFLEDPRQEPEPMDADEVDQAWEALWGPRLTGLEPLAEAAREREQVDLVTAQVGWQEYLTDLKPVTILARDLNRLNFDMKRIEGALAKHVSSDLPISNEHMVRLALQVGMAQGALESLVATTNQLGKRTTMHGRG
jgi:hypothetical protein